MSKLIRYFIFDEPAASDALVEPLAVELREHDWNIGHVVRRILTSQLFHSELVIDRKIRSPADLLIGLLRALEGTANAHELAQDLRQLGQGLFYPPNVKGWDGGRAWINSATLVDRANAVGRLVRDPKTRFGGGSLSGYVDRWNLTNGEAVVHRLKELLLATPLPSPVGERLVDLYERSTGNPDLRLAEVIQTLATLPEFHLG